MSITSKSLVFNSSWTAHEASKSKPFMLWEPNLRDVEGGLQDAGTCEGFFCNCPLSFLVNFCLCFLGLYVSLSSCLLVWSLPTLFFLWQVFLAFLTLYIVSWPKYGPNYGPKDEAWVKDRHRLTVNGCVVQIFLASYFHRRLMIQNYDFGDGIFDSPFCQTQFQWSHQCRLNWVFYYYFNHWKAIP